MELISPISKTLGSPLRRGQKKMLPFLVNTLAKVIERFLVSGVFFFLLVSVHWGWMNKYAVLWQGEAAVSWFFIREWEKFSLFIGIIKNLKLSQFFFVSNFLSMESTFCLLAVSKIYGYCFTTVFGGAGFLLGTWFRSIYYYYLFWFLVFFMKPVCLVSSSGGVTTSPVSKGLRENEEVSNLKGLG